MSVRRIALIASLMAASLSLVASPMLALTPDVGYWVTRSDPATPAGWVELHPWVWEPDASEFAAYLGGHEHPPYGHPGLGCGW